MDSMNPREMISGNAFLPQILRCDAGNFNLDAGFCRGCGF